MGSPSIRLYVQPPLSEGKAIPCTRAQTNYLTNVMRLKEGSELLVFDGQSGEWGARIEQASRGNCTLKVQQQVRAQEEGPDLHYLFAPLKRARLDYMVQKATEMGAAVLQPVLTRRTEVNRVKLDRMRANVIEAAEQCGVLRVPEVREPASLDKMLDGWKPERRIIWCDEESAVTSPLNVLKDMAPGPLAVLIGPEGGFEMSEREKLQALEFVTSLSLGPRVMRADTAAVAALALVNAVLGDWR